MAPDEWIEVTTDDIKAATPNALATGPFGSAISSRFFQDSGVPVIRGSNLSEKVGIRLSHDNLVFVSKEKAKEFQRSIVRRGDLIFTCWGTIGQVGLIDDRCPYDEYVISNKQMKLTPDPQKVDSLFLYYLFSGPQMMSMITDQAIGTSVPGFNLGQLRDLRFHLPPLSEQQAIACILGVLDDKIELNRRMNETLEGIARAIFKSWFVDFDPVRAKAADQQPSGLALHIADLFPDEFVESEEIPRGWKTGTVGEDFDITMGQSPPGETYNEDGDGLPFYQGRRDFGFRYPSVRVYCNAPTRFATAGDTLVSVRAPVGDINMAIQDCCIGRGVAAVRHKTGSCSYTYYAMQSLRHLFDRFEAEGTVFGSLNKRDFHELSFIIPPTEIVESFELQVFPVDQRIEANEQQSRTLAELRDTLLPRLISGELRVPDAERIVGRCV